MSKNPKFIYVLAFILGSTNLLAQNANSFSIEEAKEYALENHLTILKSDNEILLAEQKIIETRGLGLPQIGIDGKFSNFINLPVTVLDAQFLNPSAPTGETVAFEAGTKFTSTGTLQASQLIFNGSYIIGLKAANVFAEFQEQIAHQTKEDIVFKVIQAYELASIAKTNKSFLDSLVLSTKVLIDKQSNYLDLELIYQEDMDQLNYSLLTAQSAQYSAEIQLENATYLLKLTMGYPLNQDIELKDDPEHLLQKNSLSVDGDVHSNSNYNLLEKQIRLSELNVKNQKFTNAPSLSAFFQQSYSAYRNEFNFFANEKWYPQTLWGLQLNIPIFSGLSRYARTAQANLTLLNHKNDLLLLEQNLHFQEIQLKNNVRGAKNIFELQKENVALARSIYENSIIKENIGKGNSIVVTQKHNQLLMAQSHYIASLVELFQARLSLDKLYNNLYINSK